MNKTLQTTKTLPYIFYNKKEFTHKVATCTFQYSTGSLGEMESLGEIGKGNVGLSLLLKVRDSKK